MIIEIYGIFDENVVVLGAKNDRANILYLTPHESKILEHVVDKRRNEYATSRVLARNALSRFGYFGVEILNRCDRTPIWPEGVRGSISHCDSLSIVAITKRNVSLGIDVESYRNFSKEIWSTIFLPEEILEIESRVSELEKSKIATLFFSAKESFYKAQYFWSSEFLDFHSLQITLGSVKKKVANQGSFFCILQIQTELFKKKTMFHGKYCFDVFNESEVITAISIQHMDIVNRKITIKEKV
ncbi:4'-phosphopantetheinyl transferase superfamily protein [Acinetobacter pittii]|uniref:4'-phosphopantetheinyl transferase family protein n=1 Tax=Acinetobacter pittii TaxID=48296 RepID=UPI0021CFF9AE|nr:4'-phosphopantetheinyl transferase superfamily protein [Acinetobacter pittii]MCU4528176.1 4'-phosphopantetheinyl transferase superfamily protein [Acinetobacter pittii]